MLSQTKCLTELRQESRYIWVPRDVSMGTRLHVSILRLFYFLMVLYIGMNGSMFRLCCHYNLLRIIQATKLLKDFKKILLFFPNNVTIL